MGWAGAKLETGGLSSDQEGQGAEREFGAGSGLALAPSLLPSSPHSLLPLRPRAQSRAGQHRGGLHSGVKWGEG